MTAASQNEFARHVFAVQRYVALTAPRYAALHQLGIATHPICCFGDPARAKVITVGLNPSCGEFMRVRKWPKDLDHVALAERCRTYFSAPAPHKAHDWFGPWMEGLNYLGADYAAGSAVHLDLTPRATRFVSEFKDAWEQALFLEMVERDLWTFFGTLELCHQAERVLIAGTVTGRYYINEFLKRHAPDYGYSLDGAFNRLEHPGRGKVAWHCLSNGRKQLPVFFCSSSPSDSDKKLLPRRIRENANCWKR